MRIVPVTIADLEEYRTLPIDLEYDDYVSEVFPELVSAGGFYKAVNDDGVMMAVARTYPVLGRYAYLGSARTGIPYRGQGIATAMARFLIDDARRRGFGWAGLSTDDTNVPVHRSMRKVGLRLLGVKAFVVAKAGGLAQFLHANGIALPASAEGREVADHAERVSLLRSMLASARSGEHGSEQVGILSHEPFVVLPPNDDLAELAADQYRIRVVGGRPYLLKTGVSEGWEWSEGTFFGGNVLRCGDILADMCATAPPDKEFWLVMTPSALATVSRDSAEWSGVLRLYGADL
jgi:GNAT superfamily N-acetyltransferase